MSSQRTRARHHVALALVLSACGSGNDSAPAEQQIALQLSDTPAFELCASGTDAPECQWRFAQEVIQLGDGRFLVPDAGAEAFVFAPDGTPLGRAGRAGAGPGEFRTLFAVAPRADGGITVFDIRNFRITALTDSFTVRSITNLRPVMFTFAGMRATSDAVALLSVAVGDSVGARSDGTVTWLDVATGDSLAAVRFDARVQNVPGTDMFPLPIPLAPKLLWDVGPDRQLTIAYGDAELVRVFDRTGAQVGTITPGWSATLISDADVDSVRQALSNPGGRASVAIGYNEQVEERLRSIPTVHPLMTDVIMATNGHVWIRRGGSIRNAAEWHRFAATGEHLGVLLLPNADQLINVFGDTIALRRTNAVDVLSIVGFLVQPAVPLTP